MATDLKVQFFSHLNGINLGNNWGDLIWGVDIETGEGQNLLGKLIMEFRETLIMEFRETL